MADIFCEGLQAPPCADAPPLVAPDGYQPPRKEDIPRMVQESIPARLRGSPAVCELVLRAMRADEAFCEAATAAFTAMVDAVGAPGDTDELDDTNEGLP